ncbi:hypothetical protein L1887_14590 [Cichorium endivia]|nr:hypothetical protein L1887_14590 [Cichorium endivia]
METPQELRTFLALGEVTYAFKLGFFMYPHRHGLCCFKFLQHWADAFADDVNAGAHGDSCPTEHVAAVAVWDPAMTTTRTATAKTAVNAIKKYLAMHLSTLGEDDLIG